jgi:DNA-binding LacI/PurR family transcriptional regulator
MLAPALTTIGMPLADIAARLVDRVIGQVAGIPGGQGEILGPVLVRGRSA